MEKCCIDTLIRLNETNKKLALIGGFLAVEPFVMSIGNKPKEIAIDLAKSEAMGRLKMEDATKRLNDSGIATEIKSTLSDMQTLQRDAIRKIVLQHVTQKHASPVDTPATKFWRRYSEVTVGFSDF